MDEVGGYQMPARLAGHPGLELCNTWAGWGEPVRTPNQEYLKSFEHLAVWCGHVELCTSDDVRRLRRQGRRRPEQAAQTLGAAHALRRDLYRVLTQAPVPAASLRRVTTLVERSAAAARLVRGPAGADHRVAHGVAHWELPVSLGLELPVLAAARAVGGLLTSAEVRTVRACPGPECGWLFLDTRGRRTWCSMSSCGNRAKARTYAARHRGA
ncbi:MAG: CGNR zinc finger domain-containing protein [Nocardioidaceae bacterium]